MRAADRQVWGGTEARNPPWPLEEIQNEGCGVKGGDLSTRQTGIIGSPAGYQHEAPPMADGVLVLQQPSKNDSAPGL